MRRGLFDLNGDGELDRKERCLEWMFFEELSREEEDDAAYDEDGNWRNCWTFQSGS